jgi:two-component system OmpR family response regulator
MAPPKHSGKIEDDDVFATTEKGNAELKASGTSLSAAELQALVLVDAFSTVEQISDRLAGISHEELVAALGKLAAGHLIISTAEPDAEGTASGFSTISVPAGFFSSLLTDSQAEADGGTAILKRKGYYVRIARRPAEGHERTEGWQPTILVVDDDTDLQKLIGTYLKLEGCLPRAAFKGADIPIALRRQPAPDLILLDVHLPDVNGFDILGRMRLHPALKSIPVIMLTAESTREAVLKGLQAGADGYITKPFEVDALMSAVKAVLGLSHPPRKSGT